MGSLNTGMKMARLVIATAVLIISLGGNSVVSDDTEGGISEEKLEDLVYDYYAYPQLYAQDNHATENDGDNTETAGSDIDEFVITRNNVETNTKHVTYVPNGAVISNIEPTMEIPEEHNTLEYSEYEDDDWMNQDIAPPNGSEFDSTLTGMMGALAEIQRKGDTMLAGIRRQREVLDRLEKKAEEAEKRKEEAEVLARQMESEKQKLEDEVMELKALKDSMKDEMQEDEGEMSRVRSGLAPLLSQVSERKSELVRYESSIAAKKSELENFRTQIEEASQSLSELKNTAVTVSAPNSITNSPVLLVALAISIGFNLLAGAQAVRTLLPDQRVDSFVTQFTESKQGEEIAAIAASKFAGVFDSLGVRRRVVNGDREDMGLDLYNQPQTEELYSYSDLPRLF